MFLKVLKLLLKLVQELPAYIAGTHNKKIDLLIGRFKEIFMEHIDRLSHIRCIDDRRYVPLGRPLGYCPDIDSITTQRTKHFSTDTCMTFHMISHQGNDGQARF